MDHVQIPNGIGHSSQPIQENSGPSSSQSFRSSSQRSDVSSASSSSQSTDSPTITRKGPKIILQFPIQDMHEVEINGSGSSSDNLSNNSTDERHTIGSNGYKQYKNSPFGLNNHYITMPDSESPQNHKYTQRFRQPRVKNRVHGHKLEPSDSDNSQHQANGNFKGNRDKNQASKSYVWNHKDPSLDLDFIRMSNNTDTCDLTVLPTTSDASISADWQDFKSRQKDAIRSQPRLLSPMSLASFSRSYKIQTPAGDAGLDAKECNAKGSKDGDCFYYPKANDSSSKNCDLNSKPNVGSDRNNSIESEGEHNGGLLVRCSSIMYATFLVILGCILHVSELRQKSVNSSDHIYTIVVAMIGILWLIFLQLDLQRYKRYASKYILIETIFNDQRLNNLRVAQKHYGLRSASGDPTARSTTSSSASLVNDRMSMNTEVIFKKTAYKMNQQRAAFKRQKSSHPKNYQGHNFTHRPRSDSKISSSSGDCDTDFKLSKESYQEKSMADSGEGSSVYLDRLIPAYKFLHGKMGANFYLKCGMAAFCFGHIIHEGLRFGQQVYFFGTGNGHCRDSAALIAHLITPLYSFYQLFMMFKYSNLVINRHKVLARFGLMHIIGTSVTFWFRTIIEEAFEDFVHKMDYFKANKPQLEMSLIGSKSQDQGDLTALLTSISRIIAPQSTERSDWTLTGPQDNMTVAKSLFAVMSSPMSATITPQIARHLPDSYACAQNTLLTTKSMNTLPYLYPFTIEYNLLLAATFLSLYFNIGKIRSHGSNCDQLPATGHMTHNGNPFKATSMSSSRISHVETSDNSSVVRSAGDTERELGEYKSNFVVNADCHSANKGLFCGFFVLLVTLVTIVIFFVTINKPTHVQLGIKINLIQEATLTTLILIVTIAGFKQVVKLNRNPYLREKVTTDDVLMLIPLPFFFIHSLLAFRAETASMYSGTIFTPPSIFGKESQLGTSGSQNFNSKLIAATINNASQSDPRIRINNSLVSVSNTTGVDFDTDFINNTNNTHNNGSSGSGSSNGSRNIGITGSGTNSSQIDNFKLITVALNIIVMIEVLVQTNFIIDGMRRCSESRYLRFKKPGRELITFAIILNITYWIVATFETKSVEQYKTEIEYYGPLPYMFISHTTLPVMLFYRYHSSVCLAEMWNRAYKPPKKR